MFPYTLADYVFACRDDGHVVLLDLERDRYLSLDAARVRGLEDLVSGWPPSATRDRASAGRRAAEQLIERGLLVRGDPETPRPARVAVSRPSFDLSSGDYADRPALKAGQLWAFVRATVVAAILLRIGLKRAVLRVRHRNAGLRDSAIAPDTARTAELVAAFTAMRPFLFTSREACLFESLVLLEYLARYSIFPAWVFGVRARPFAAHCWVQAGDTVLNDSVAHVARYEPIMAV